MKQKLLPFAIRLLVFTLILFLLHFLINQYILEAELFYSLPVIYIFHFLATFLVFILLVVVYNNYKDFTGYAFMGGSFMKMLAAIVFLLPMLLNNTGYAFVNLLYFFIPYFLFLFFETFYAVKLINSK